MGLVTRTTNSIFEIRHIYSDQGLTSENPPSETATSRAPLPGTYGSRQRPSRGRSVITVLAPRRSTLFARLVGLVRAIVLSVTTDGQLSFPLAPPGHSVEKSRNSKVHR